MRIQYVARRQARDTVEEIDEITAKMKTIILETDAAVEEDEGVATKPTARM